MARSRNIKPGFFTNEELVELAMETRLLFIGIWTIADRDGRLEDRPKRIKMQVFPADDVDVDRSLNQLVESGFIQRYEVAGEKCIQVVNWSKHQSPHVKENASTLPAPDSVPTESNVVDESPVQEPDKNQTTLVPAPPDSLLLIPDSLNSDSLIPDSSTLSGESEGASAPRVRSKPPAYSQSFEQFWTAYPSGHGDKKPAFEQWKPLKPDSALVATILAGLDAWKKSDRWQRGYIRDAQRWLKDRSWENPPPADVATVANSRAAPVSALPRNAQIPTEHDEGVQDPEYWLGTGKYARKAGNE